MKKNVDSIIEQLKDIDGETMEYIVKSLCMVEQLFKQTIVSMSDIELKRMLSERKIAINSKIDNHEDLTEYEVAKIKQSDLNLDAIDNFILHLTHCSHNDIEGNVPFTITSNQLYESARDYIEVDHVDGKGNTEDNTWFEVALSYVNDGGTESIAAFYDLKVAIDYANNCTDSMLRDWYSMDLLKEDSVEFVFIDKWIKDNSDTNIKVDNFDAIIFRNSIEDYKDEISTDTIMSGIVCNKCKEEIPPHSVEQHLDPKFMEHFHKCSTTDLEKFWNGKASSMIGKKIIQARYMTKEEAEEMGWYKQPLIFIFDDGSHMFSSKDDEGNDGGAIFGQDEDGLMDFPVL